jgi:phosphoglycolate phosphatase
MTERKQTGRFAGVRLLIFDLDGTLVDSSRDLANAVNAARARMGLGALAQEQIREFIGHGAPMLVRRALGPDASDADVERALGFFREHYRAHLLDYTKAYAGVEEALRELASRGFAGDERSAMPDRSRGMAVLTNKPTDFSEVILEGLGLRRYFRRVYGGESFEWKKPHPIGVQALLDELKATPSEALMIGDSEVDIETARNAGVWACGVTYGLGSHRLAEFPPDLLLDNLADLPGHL